MSTDTGIEVEIDMLFDVIHFMQVNAAAITENRWGKLKDEWDKIEDKYDRRRESNQ